MAITTEKAGKLIENINTAVLVFDHGLHLVHMNTAGENLLSISQRKALGNSANDILSDLPQFVETIQRSVASRQPFTERGIHMKLNNLKSITIDCMVTPVIEEDQCHEVIVELIDAHSYNRVMREESLSALHDAARKSLHGMAHEVKNPLGGLRGAAQLLERELNGSELTEYTQIIISEADRLRNLIDRMLTPNEKQHVERVNVHEVLEYVISIIEAELNTVLNIERDYDPSLPDLYADREQLIQAMLNILKNAGQAIDKNGQICLRTRIKRKYTIRQHNYKLVVQIEVIDDGPGVPVEIQSEVFYPMVTGRANGTGLGLSIAQSLIQSHRGIIEYERIDQSTIFRILLPLDEADV